MCLCSTQLHGFIATAPDPLSIALINRDPEIARYAVNPYSHENTLRNFILLASIVKFRPGELLPFFSLSGGEVGRESDGGCLSKG